MEQVRRHWRGPQGKFVVRKTRFASVAMAAALTAVASSAGAACGEFVTCYENDTLTLRIPVTASVGGR